MGYQTIYNKCVEMKNTIRLSQRDLCKIVKEAVEKAFGEFNKKVLYAYDCEHPRSCPYQKILVSNNLSFEKIKKGVQWYLSKKIPWMDDRHLADIDDEITKIVNSLIEKGESGFIYTYCFYLKDDLPKCQ